MKLYFINGPKAGEEFTLTPPAVKLGRETDNEVSLLIGGVSRYHARIDFVNDAWFLSDLGSTNGTKLNGELIADQAALNHGDIITLGEQNIFFGEKGTSTVAAKQQNALIHDTIPQQAVQFQEFKPAFEPLNPQAPAANVPPVAPPPVFQPIGTPIPPPTPQAQTINDKEIDKNRDTAAKDFFAQPSPHDKSKDSEPLNSSHIFKMNFFSKSPDSKASSSNNSKTEAPGKKKIFSNILFYTTVIGMAAIFISVFMMIQKSKIKPPESIQKPQTASILVSYSKQITSPDNIFKFTLLVENNSASFTLDDMKSQRHFSKQIKELTPEAVANLDSKIRTSDFMRLQQDAAVPPVNGIDTNKKLTISYDKDLNSIEVRNNFAPNSFETIESAIDEFAEHYGLRTISLTPAEMKKEAEKSFTKAEQLFLNREARPENLREAIARYKIAVDLLDQFNPKPEQWDIARKRSMEAEAMLKEKIDKLVFDFSRYMNLKEYSEAREVCSQIMLMEDPDSKRYAKVKENKLNLDLQLKGNKK